METGASAEPDRVRGVDRDACAVAESGFGACRVDDRVGHDVLQEEHGSAALSSST